MQNFQIEKVIKKVAELIESAYPAQFLEECREKGLYDIYARDSNKGVFSAISLVGFIKLVSDRIPASLYFFRESLVQELRNCHAWNSSPSFLTMAELLNCLSTYGDNETAHALIMHRRDIYDAIEERHSSPSVKSELYFMATHAMAYRYTCDADRLKTMIDLTKHASNQNVAAARAFVANAGMFGLPQICFSALDNPAEIWKRRLPAVYALLAVCTNNEPEQVRNNSRKLFWQQGVMSGISRNPRSGVTLPDIDELFGDVFGSELNIADNSPVFAWRNEAGDVLVKVREVNKRYNGTSFLKGTPYGSSKA